MTTRNRSARRHEHEQKSMGFRAFSMRTSSLNIEDRSIEADVSTENPVEMPDFVRGEMVPEILVSSGAILPASRQVPFLDSHQRTSVNNQLGSARELSVVEDKLTARLQFSAAADGEFTKVREGHVTDVSAGYQILKKKYVARGETATIEGRDYTGPANVVTSWRLMEVSLTPIGADSMAKMRGLSPESWFSNPSESEFVMNEKLRAAAVSRGMSISLTDDEAQSWIADNMSAAPAASAAPTGEKMADGGMTPEEKKKKDEEAAMAAMMSGKSLDAQIESRIAVAIAKVERQRAAFFVESDATCKLAGKPNEMEVCRKMQTIEQVRAHLTEVQAKDGISIGSGHNLRTDNNGFERMVKDMQTSLSLRALTTSSSNAAAIDSVFPVDQRGKGHATFKHASPWQMAEEYVRSSGIDTRGLTRETVAICAMFGPERAGLGQRGVESAYHVTGNFSNVTLDAVNKSLMLGYVETPSTWKGPIRQAASVQDFKTINRIRMGSIANLPVWNDNKNPEMASFTDAKESYAVEARSLEISYSFRLLVNDDMDVLSRTPAMMGAAAARTVNAVAWSQVTSNPTLGADSIALFSAATGARKRANLTTGAATPTVATLQTLSNLMRQMRGENTPEGAESSDILNLTPRYLVGPSALDTTIKQLVLSAYDPAANTFQVYNTATQLIPVIEPLLDANSATAFYLFADPSNQIDTIEVTFLAGQESPVTRSFLDDRNLSQSITIMQTFAAKAMNHRGVQKHAGV